MNNVPLITITIPVYNNPLLLAECLKSIQNQTFKNYKVLIVDDNSSADYAGVVNAFKNMPIEYIKNPQNLGAVPNMMYCIHRNYETNYFMVFHEDDVLHPRFLEISLDELQKSEKSVFSCCNMNFFFNYDEINFDKIINNNVSYCSLKDCIFEILKGCPISWSSVVYRSNLDRPFFDYQKYSMLGDRPFLLEIVKDNNCVFIKNPLVVAFGHKSNDTRWKTLHWYHIINLYKFYFSFFRNSTRQEIKSIKKWGTIQLFANYKLLTNQSVKVFIPFVFSGFYHNLISFKYLLLQNSRIRHLIEKCKNAHRLHNLRISS